MNTLTIVIPSYNNLEYLKLCYTAIRKSSSTVELIIFDDGSTDGTYSWLQTLNDKHLVFERFEQRIGHTLLYDRGFHMATTEFIGILHADMVVSKNFFDVLLPLLKEGNVVSARCVEPPLHPPGREKIVQNFGMDSKEFNYQAFSDFCSRATPINNSALFAPWFIHKGEYFNKVGGHDAQFAPYGYEDSDLFVRMIKAGINPIQYEHLRVYHFTQRGHKWNHGTVGQYHMDYHLQMQLTQNRFLQKWGTLLWKNDEHTPINIPLYYKQLRVKNYKYGNNKYEFLNKFFNRVLCDEGIIKSDGNSTSPNYELVFDYNINYNLEDLQSLMMQVPFIVEEYDVGTYDLSGITINILDKTEL